VSLAFKAVSLISFSAADALNSFSLMSLLTLTIRVFCLISVTTLPRMPLPEVLSVELYEGFPYLLYTIGFPSAFLNSIRKSRFRFSSPSSITTTFFFYSVLLDFACLSFCSFPVSVSILLKRYRLVTYTNGIVLPVLRGSSEAKDLGRRGNGGGIR
jgi:hypothetical protein